MPLTKEEMRAYRKSPAGKKSMRIAKWKYRGIIVDDNDWDYFYDYYLSVTHCHMCQKELTEDKTATHSTRCVDHDHSINDRPNVRMICCHACNLNDRLDNTSGEPNISYYKKSNCWRFKKTIQGKRYAKHGFKTKEEAIDYKHKFLASLSQEKDS